MPQHHPPSFTLSVVSWRISSATSSRRICRTSACFSLSDFSSGEVLPCHCVRDKTKPARVSFQEDSARWPQPPLCVLCPALHGDLPRMPPVVWPRTHKVTKGKGAQPVVKSSRPLKTGRSMSGPVTNPPCHAATVPSHRTALTDTD